MTTKRKAAVKKEAFRTIPLTQGKVSLVDAEDFHFLNAHRWQFHEGYARRNVKKWEPMTTTTVTMSRFIMSAKNGAIVDHINGDGLDNRRSNLRFATKSQNGMNRKVNAKNSTGFKGVHFCKRDRRYIAYIRLNGKQHQLGGFKTAQEAAVCYSKAAKKMFGEFAKVQVL